MGACVVGYAVVATLDDGVCVYAALTAFVFGSQPADCACLAVRCGGDSVLKEEVVEVVRVNVRATSSPAVLAVAEEGADREVRCEIVCRVSRSVTGVVQQAQPGPPYCVWVKSSRGRTQNEASVVPCRTAPLKRVEDKKKQQTDTHRKPTETHERHGGGAHCLKVSRSA